MTKYLKKNGRINVSDLQYINAFEKLKELITNHPIRHYPNFHKKFKLATDAGKYAIGAVLSQDNHPICYASRTLNKHEIMYSAIEKELLAIIWSISYFRPYLYGVEFDVLTDHQPIKWLHSKKDCKDISSRLQRWVLKLGEYSFKIDYIKGKDNNVADFLSRINTDKNEINAISINENMSEANSRSAELGTIHSQDENFNDHIPIVDTIVNKYKTQLILLDLKTKEMDIVPKYKRIYVCTYTFPRKILLLTG